jgi:hypothetical protein
METTYEKSSKRLIGLIQRLEQWFRGEKLYEQVEQDGFRWNYFSGHFEWQGPNQKWNRVINARNPNKMIECAEKIQLMHEQARKAKQVQENQMLLAATSLEKYLLELGKDADLSGPPKWA